MSAEHFKIGLDFDDVLFSSADQTLKLNNDLYGTHLTRSEWYDDPTNLEPWELETYEEVVARVVDLQRMDAFLYGVKPLRGSRRVLRRLKNAGAELPILTGRPEELRERTRLLVTMHFGDILDPDNLHFTNHFGHGGQRIDKGDVGERLGLTHEIDDVVGHANNVASHGIQAVLFDDGYPWNQQTPDEGVLRLKSWKEIGEYFDGQL